MRGTKKYKIVKCFRHFGAIIILLWLISIVRFPYSFDKLQVLSNKNFESVSNSMLTLVDCKSTESKSSIDFLLTDGKQYYIITAKRFFIWNRYDLSQLMPFSEETSYSYQLAYKNQRQVLCYMNKLPELPNDIQPNRIVYPA